jgi:hypothetical protein
MWLFEVKWLRLKFNDADHTQTETETKEWVVAPDLPTVYETVRYQIEGIPDHEWVSIVRHVPVVSIINEKPAE